MTFTFLNKHQISDPSYILSYTIIDILFNYFINKNTYHEWYHDAILVTLFKVLLLQQNSVLNVYLNYTESKLHSFTFYGP